MGKEALQKHRRIRLDEAATKAGGKAALGRLLGYQDGAFVGQMIRGERLVTEETVLKLEAKPGFKNWFGGSPPEAERESLTDEQLALLRDMDDLLQEDRDRIRQEVSSLAARMRQHEAQVLEKAARARDRPSGWTPLTTGLPAKKAARNLRLGAERRKGAPKK